MNTRSASFTQFETCVRSVQLTGLVAAVAALLCAPSWGQVAHGGSSAPTNSKPSKPPTVFGGQNPTVGGQYHAPPDL